MKRFYILLLALLIGGGTSNLLAGDSGAYDNPARNGEGIVLVRRDNIMVVYLFTYGEEVCGLPIPAVPSPEPEGWPEGYDCQPIGQRWFIGADGMDSENVVSGLLYITDGFHYPTGQNGVVGTETAVGVYTLVRADGGWLLAVDRFGPELEADDYLFSTIFEFTDPIVKATD